MSGLERHFQRSNHWRKVLWYCILFSIGFLRSAAAESDAIRVGVLASLTGNWAAIGQNIQRGVTLAGEEANGRGGALGKKIVFDIQDTDEEKSGAKVVSAYRHLQQQGVKFFIGPTGVPGILALTPLAAKDDVILIGPTATNSFYKSSPKFFNASGDNYVTTKAAATRAYARGFRKVAIFGSLQPWESEQASTFKKEFAALGGLITGEEYPAADQPDLRIEALRIIKSNPDAVFFAIFNQVAVAAKALEQQGFKGAKFASIMDDSHVEASNGTLDGTELYLFEAPGEAFVENYKQRFNEVPGVFADSAYDAAISLATAINDAKTTEREPVIAALHKLTFTGSSGRGMNYDADGLIARRIALFEIAKGKLVSKTEG